jgi:hypothetical protein
MYCPTLPALDKEPPAELLQVIKVDLLLVHGAQTKLSQKLRDRIG